MIAAAASQIIDGAILPARSGIGIAQLNTARRKNSNSSYEVPLA
jgi:hypothetical protein